MQQRYETSPNETKGMDTAQLRANFLLENLFAEGEINFVYSHYDRMVVGGICPGSSTLDLPSYDTLRSNFFLERREMGIINIGGKGIVTADGQRYELDKLGCVYLGRGTKEVSFASSDAGQGARFYAFSAPAHQAYSNQAYTKEQATPVTLGEAANANRRTIYKYIHGEGIPSCQVVMGLTVLHEGSVWNTMPAHTHDRRSEIYLYFDIAEGQGVMHFMGQAQETRHLWMRSEQAVISPPWSIHAGSGTGNYSFIWAMAGENQDFTDMDFIPLADLR